MAPNNIAQQRAAAVRVLGVALLLGLISIAMFQRYEAEAIAWLERQIPWLLDHPRVALLITLALFAPLIALGVYLYRFGSRLLPEEGLTGGSIRPGTSNANDSGIVRRARALRLLAILLVAAAIVAALMLWRILLSLGGAAA